MGRSKPFGVMLGLLGNLMIALALMELIQTGECGDLGRPACPDSLTPYLIMLPAGIMTSIAAVFFGGGGLTFLGIFLAVGIGSIIGGFQTEDPGTASFGKWFGGLFAGLPLLLLVGLLLAGRSGKKKLERAQDLVETGGRGIGTVTAVRDTGMTINDNPRVEISMRVEPEDGAEVFDVSKTITVSRVAIPRAGDRFPVFYDRSDVGNWIYGTDMDPALTPPDIQGLFGKAAQPVDDGPADELAKLDELRRAGVLTDAEFETAKARLLSPERP